MNHNLHIHEWIARFAVSFARGARLRNVEFIGQAVKAEMEYWIDDGSEKWKTRMPENAVDDSLEEWHK